ncbi:MAG: type II-B CRISPR-associated RNA-guided endonuclease Cas9/Csx12 [Gammaproteobacteria bacterium]|nr:type II-B CRISPR-associated RNA-guided endonuclease Cas9/Csx12 [Gammaproteobacteria bacterium]
MDKVNLDDSEKTDIKAHLHHLAFALHKVHGELQSGGRHRSKYFEEVKIVLARTDHTHDHMKGFCKNLQSGHFRGLTVDGLSNLLGHISNLELKPLRKYFNDEKHRGGDYWDESRITRLFERWVLREWRVGEKDKDKADGGKWTYLELKNRWNQRGGSVVDFWLETPPEYTIPPYQDNNNRRPPKCQSLLLNVGFLNRKYGGWREWLGELKGVESVRDYLGDYEGQLKELESGKGMRYFGDERAGKPLTDSGRRSMAELDARVLQFILDRVKAEDALNLNEIYSYAKKIKQDKHKKDDESVNAVEKAKEELGESIKNSGLPQGLKIEPDYGSDDLFPGGSFFHLICKYYKLRQRARDGRIFIHPEYRYAKESGYKNTGRFDDKGHLLTYCNHKPRQKRYQTLGDLAGVLQVSPHHLEQFADKYVGETTDDKLLNWLCGIDRLKANCDRAAKEQKDRRGRLKLDILDVFSKADPKSSKVKGAKKFHGFCERAKQICFALTEPLYDDSRQQSWQKELDKNPATAVYLLAQINNIAFKERSGNANTCAVCSTDNAHRMQMVSAADGKDTTAKAQRLPAIPTRLIDGAVMRMARIVGGAIARDKWEKIAAELAANKRVCVPIITESNQFEFEPSKDELVKGQRTRARKGKPLERGGELKIAASKDERIRAAGKGVCPYTGESVPEIGGDKDHIIPRSSGRGTLNDEANLIWASDRGNKEVKKDREFSLANLNGEYKRAVFGGKSDTQIKNWIVEQIGDGSGEDFEFGKYRSFINLSPEQQTAFRHALFLVGHPLREKVINAIDNKNRAFVNGTQRYFAEVLANQLYKLAKSEGKDRRLSFDYFGVESKPNSAGDSIYDLRKMHEEYDGQIAEYAKSKDSKQQAYSHLIDAQLAFVIVADAHRGEGGLKLQIDDAVGKTPYNADTGEIDGGLLGAIRVSDDDFGFESLGRRKVYEVETHHRELLNGGDKKAVHISYRIHRSNSIAEKFMPLIRLENGEFRKGFSVKNSVEYKSADFEAIKGFLCAGKSNQSVWLVNRKDALNFLMDGGRNGLDRDGQKVAKLLDGLIYQTIKKPVSSVLTPSGSKEPQTVSDALENWDKCIAEAKFKKGGVVLPVFGEWRKLKTEIENASPEQPLQVFLQNSKMFGDKHNSNIRSHNKKRKVYSLPVVATIGSIRLQRKAWSGQNVIQTAAEESIAKYGLDSKQRPHTVLSKNSIPVKHYTGIPENLRPEPREWKKIPEESIAAHNSSGGAQIFSGKVKHQDAGRCRALLKVDDIQKLSLPQDKKNWKGKLFRHENVATLEERVGNEKGNNHHCLSSEWWWFSAPFKLPDGRNEVTVKNVDGIYEIEFTVQKTAEIKRWLLS